MSSFAPVPLGYCVSEVRRKNLGGREQNLLSLSYGRIIRKDIDSAEGLLPESFDTYNIVEPGDTVLRLTDLQNDQRSLRVGLVAERGIITSAYVTVRPTARVNERFLNYFLKMMDFRKDFYALGAGVRQSLKFDELRRVQVSVPDLAAQRAIADYLDAETARIDALIAKKRLMLELLDERFLVGGKKLIAGGSPADGQSPRHAWAGPVPTTWRLLKIASFARVGSGTTPASDVDGYYSEDGVAWVTTTELRESEILSTTRAVTELALRDYSALKVFPAGTVLVAMYGATVGRVGTLGIPATTNQACCAIYEGSELNLRFLYWWLVLNRQHLLDLAYGAGQPNISQETVRSLRVPAPELHEQQTIAETLDAEADRFGRTREALVLQIELLLERRQALITAAVTGELNIPGAAA